MPSLDLPAAGEKPWDVKLNTALTVLNVEVDAIRDITDGGTTGQVWAKASAADGDIEWTDLPDTLPGGGATGQVLTKQSGADGDADWETPASPLKITPAAGMIMRYGLGTNNVANVSQRLTMHPLVIADTVTVDAFIIQASGTSSSGGDLGLYPSNADGTPNFTSGPLRSATYTHGTNPSTVTFTALQLNPGYYWAALRGASTNPTYLGFVTIPPDRLPYAPAGWLPTTIGYSDLSVASLPSGSFTPTKLSLNSATGIPSIALRISSVP